MNRRLVLSLALTAIALLFATGAMAATIDVSLPKNITNTGDTGGNGYYERDPELLIVSGGTWYLIYSRSQTSFTPGGNPDNLKYDIYYQTSADNGATWSVAAKVLDAAAIGASANFRSATVCEADGKIWVIGSNIESLQGDIYANTYSAGSWAGQSMVFDGTYNTGAFHVDAVTEGDDIRLFYGIQNEGNGVGFIKYHGDTDAWDTAVTQIGAAAGYQIPRVIKDGSTYHLVSTDWSSILFTSTSTPDVTPWPSAAAITTAPVGGASSDPCVLKYGDGGGTADLLVFHAPWYADDTQPQEYVYSTNAGSSWSSSVAFTEALHGAQTSWDMMPRAYMKDASTVMSFFGMEKRGVNRGQADIVCVEWGLSSTIGNQHYTTLQDGISNASASDRIDVAAGTYAERITISKSLELRGAQYGVDPTQAGARTNPATESTIDITGLGVTNPNVAVEIPSGVKNVTLDGFTLIGSPTSYYADESVVRCWDDNITIQNNIVNGYFGILDKGNDYRTFSQNRITVNKVGVTVQPNAATNVTISGNSIVRGASPASDAAAIYFANVNTAAVTDNAGSNFPGSNGVGGSNLTNVTVSGNTFTGNVKGVNFWGTTTFITISDNDLSNSSVCGINIKGQDVTISGNVIRNCGDAGVVIARHVIDTRRVSVTGNDLGSNMNYGVKVDTVSVTETVNASGNWWGSNSPSGVRSEANGGSRVDYTPWLDVATNMGGGPGFQGDLSALHVDDDSPQTGAVSRVQEGVNLVTGSTVQVEPGTYNERVIIGKSVVLTGDPGDPAVAGPGTNAPVFDGTGFSAVPAFSVSEGVSDVTVEGFEIRNYGPTGNTNAVGVSTWSSGTSNVNIRDNYMHDLGYAGVLTGNGWGSAQGLHDNWQVTYNIVGPTGAYGFDMENVKNSVVNHNVVSGIPWYAVNVIALATQPGASVTSENIEVKYNTISGCADRNINLLAWTDGGTDRTAALQDVTVANNTVSGVFNLIIAWKMGTGTNSIRDLAVDNNTLTVNNPKGAGYAVDLADVAGTSSFSGNTLTLTGTVEGGGTFFHGLNVGGGSTGTWTMAGNLLDGNNVGAASCGYRLRSTLPASCVLDITGNDVTEFATGIRSDPLASGADVDVNYCSIAGNSSYGVMNGSGAVIDASYCWWGAASGPYHSSNPSGTGNQVSDYVQFVPWLGSVNEVAVVPASTLTNCSSPKAVTFYITRAGVPDEARGYEVAFDVDTTVVTVASLGDIDEGTFLSSVGGTQFYVTDEGAGTYTVSCAILGGDVGATGSGALFTVLLTPVAQGTSPITITSIKLRDLDNSPLPASGVGGSIRVDCTYPTMEALAEAEGAWYKAAPAFSNFGFDDDVNLDVAEYQIDAGGWTVIFTGIGGASWDSDGWVLPGFVGLSEGSHTVYFRVKDDAGNWNGEGGSQPNLYSWWFRKDTTLPSPPTNFVARPGHDKTHLTWTNPAGDPTFAGVELRLNGWEDYPEYVPPEPSYPGDHTQGTFVVLTAGAAYDDNPRTPRDIYYYSAFSADSAGNYSSLGTTAKDRATSYWLGDLDADGNVYTTDLVTFSASFGLRQGQVGWNNICDFGPSHNNSRFGIPIPDDRVNFEDLMIFSMNWSKVAPSGVGRVLVAGLVEALEDLVKFEVVWVNDNTVSIVLSNRALTLKGIHLVVDVASGELVSVERGSLLSGKGDVFFGTVPGEDSDISVAALGEGVALSGSGEVARLHLRQPGGGPCAIRFRAVDLRNVDNDGNSLMVPQQYEAPFVPAATALMQNYPNPFNPVTVVTYDLAKAGRVTVQVFDVSGRLVRTLVDESRASGRYSAEWNGRDEAGVALPSGVYFCSMQTPGFSASQKMIMVR